MRQDRVTEAGFRLIDHGLSFDPLKAIFPRHLSHEAQRDRADRLVPAPHRWPVAIRLRWASEPSSERAHAPAPRRVRSEEHTSELQSLMRTSYAVSCLTKTT